MSSRNRFSPLAILLALGLSACSGAGGGTAPSGLAPGAPQQPSQPGTETATQTYTLASAASSYAFPPLAGFSGSIAMPAATVPAATTLQLTSALQPPAGGPTLQDVHTFAQSAGILNVYFFTTIRLSATITFQSLPGFSLTLPKTINPTGQQFFYAVSTSTPNSGAVLSFGTQGPATVADQTVTFAPSNNPLTLLAGKSYIVAFYAISAITATPTAKQEKIYVTDPSNNVVTTYSLDGSLASPRISDGVFNPVSIGVDPSGNIAIANNALDVPQYHASGGTPFNVISGLIASSNLNVTPRALAVNASGTIYVLNTYSDGSANITSYTQAGQQFKPLIPLASGEVVTIAVDDNGKIYVSRAFSASISIIDGDGNQLGFFFTPNLALALSVAVNSNGSRIYLTSDFPSARINTFDGKGKQMPPTILLKNGSPVAVAVDPNGNIFVRSSAGELTSYSSNGKQIKPTIEGLGGLPAGGIAVR